MKRRITALVLIVMLVCTLAFPVSAELNADVRNSVVAVSISLNTEMGNMPLGSGTGFFVNEQYLVTNHHVIDAFLEYGAGELVEMNMGGNKVDVRAVIEVNYDSDDYEEAYVVGYDEHKDIAILRLDEPTQKRTPLKLKAPTEDMVGKNIYAVGFPGMPDKTAGATRKWGKNDATVTAGSISRLLTQSGTGRQSVQIDCEIKPGNSGGPVVTSDGTVIGVATWFNYTTEFKTDEENQLIGVHIEELHYAVNVSEVILMLNQYGVSYTSATDVVISDATEAITVIETPVESKSNLPVILGVVAAIVIIAGLAVVVVVMKKNGKLTGKNAAKPIARSYSKHNYGTAVNVGTQPILIGRSGNCSLRFPSNTPGVSGSHCTVQWDAATKDFIVTDMNSTYGTFLISGERMRPNHPYRMRAGDKFYLAEQGNTIGLSLE